MIGCIVITLKEKDDQRTGDTLIGYPVFANSLNHSGFNHLFPRKIRTLLRRFFIKLRAIGMIVFSRENIKYTSRRLFTMRTLCIVVSSIVIGNIVRYYAIKYGIDTPLLSHPILFSSAAGISSFLSIFSRITIEDIFNLFDDKQLALPVGELPVSKNSLTIDTNMKMVRGTGSGTVIVGVELVIVGIVLVVLWYIVLLEISIFRLIKVETLQVETLKVETLQVEMCKVKVKQSMCLIPRMLLFEKI